MTKEKLASLTKYADSLKNRLSAPVPEKHAGHPQTYTQFLNRELELVTRKIESAKLEGAAK